MQLFASLNKDVGLLVAYSRSISEIGLDKFFRLIK